MRRDQDIAVWAQANLRTLDGGRAVVTGGGSGIGLAVSRGLAALGAHVVIADRDAAAGEAAAGAINALGGDGSASFRAVDLAEPEAVSTCAAALGDAPVDILVNNAGILPPLRRRTTARGDELAFAISVLGHFALTASLLPALGAAHAPRVVWLSSLVHRRGRIDLDDLDGARNYEAQNAYNQAKIASLMLAMEMDRRGRERGSHIASLAAHPGVARTAIGHSRDGQARVGLHDHLTDLAFHGVMRLMGQPADVASRPVLRAAADRSMAGGSFFGPGGFGEMRGASRLLTPTPVARDASARACLWAYCERRTGHTFPWRAHDRGAAA
ncbi:SDR family NAD(P)-dependent oxidoreductase [Algiphilus sp.]|uniref:SDR family NAD(P)-dependent oxidoreductase n=2 Tax=Algiphilus sp. TaxID=1872431 RepID=UPI0025C35451|nr:SDR family NAD(P)-dependent oxidoreductase [Algiphilus sp.]MCK5769666.1 SDR family NAD(P)-dependent oxidoreductase [Algiphilus sp.]